MKKQNQWTLLDEIGAGITRVIFKLQTLDYDRDEVIHMLVELKATVHKLKSTLIERAIGVSFDELDGRR